MIILKSKNKGHPSITHNRTQPNSVLLSNILGESIICCQLFISLKQHLFVGLN